MLYDIKSSSYSLYFHWPFCPYRCHYCPFIALAGHEFYMERYHKALMMEVCNYSINNMFKDDNVISIFFGGGTPSTYPILWLKELFSVLHATWFLASTVEITIEVNPGTVNEEMLNEWKQLGVNRISIGVQSLKDTVLQGLNRLQLRSEVEQLVAYAYRYIPVVSIDLILGLPEVSEDEWKAYISTVVTWNIQHISIYFLTIHEDTQLYFKVEKGLVRLPSDESVVSLYVWTVDFLSAHGFIRYELSNFAKDGLECKHNSVYWERFPYKAFGLGACSFDGSRRFQNEKNLLKYLEKVEKKDSPIVFTEHLTPKQIVLERIMLQLRKSSGVIIEELFTYVSESFRSVLDTRIKRLQEKGFLIKSADTKRLMLTSKGFVLENQIITQLLE